MSTVARNIRAQRVEIGLTQRGLADVVGVDPMIVSKWERGRHRPSHENMMRLASALGQSVAWFYTDHDAVAA